MSRVEWGIVVGVVAIFAIFFYVSAIRPVHQFEEACEAAGGKVWERDGRACLLPPYNRLEI